MALTVTELPGVESSVNDQNVTEYTRRFRVIADSKLASPFAIRQASGLPQRGDAFERQLGTTTDRDETATCKSISVSQDEDNPLLWNVRATYGRMDSEAEQVAENPLERPSEIAWSFASFTKVAEQDINGRGILNSAGDYFDPPAEIDDSRLVLAITRNEAAFNPAIATDYQDALNSDTWYGFEPGQVKLTAISAQRAIENRRIYWRVSYEFHFRRDTWKLKILDRGKRKIAGSPDFLAYINARDENGTELHDTPVTEPVPLDGNGGELLGPSPNTVHYLEFDVYKSRSFAALGLP